jgi:penicillin-binding protein 1A
MLELRFIDQAQYDEAIESLVESRLYGPKVELEAPYVTEMVRAEMVRRYGLDAYTIGLKVVTTIDSRLQIAARTALRTALLEYDRRHGYRGPAARNVLAGLAAEVAAPDGPPADPGSDLPTPDAVPADDADPDDIALNRLLSAFPDSDDLHIAVVLATAKDNSADVFVRDFGPVTLPWENLKWRPYIDDNSVGAAPKSIDDMVAAGDLIYVLHAEDKGWLLAQMPQVQGAFVALDPRDGGTAALVGGFDFFASKYNRAVQSKRQPGSSFKPFIYSAALENGFTTATLVNDAPVVFDDDALETTWRPENYSRQFHGPTRLREALVRSLNLVSVRILRGAGIGPALRHIEHFGLPASALPRDLSLALGSGGASPWELAAGYAVFANGGYRTEPYIVERVENAQGEVVFQADPAFVCVACDTIWIDGADPDASEDDVEQSDMELSIQTVATDSKAVTIIPPDAAYAFDDEVPPYTDAAEMIAHGREWRPTPEEAPQFFAKLNNPARRAITAENAYLIYDMMRDVIQRGTGRRARELGRNDLGGKTGTSNDRRDAWFSGFNGDIVGTAWIGFDQDRSLGAGEEGSRTALPLWKYFMKEALTDAPTALIGRPPGIITARIVPETGLVAPAGYNGAIFELFREGHVPEMQTDGSGFQGNPDGFDNLDDEGEIIF